MACVCVISNVHKLLIFEEVLNRFYAAYFLPSNTTTVDIIIDLFT